MTGQSNHHLAGPKFHRLHGCRLMAHNCRQPLRRMNCARENLLIRPASSGRANASAWGEAPSPKRSGCGGEPKTRPRRGRSWRDCSRCWRKSKQGIQFFRQAGLRPDQPQSGSHMDRMKNRLEFGGPEKRVNLQAHRLPLSTPLVLRPASFHRPSSATLLRRAHSSRRCRVPEWPVFLEAYYGMGEI